MNLNGLRKQIKDLKQRISQLHQFGYMEEVILRTGDLRVLESKLEDLERQEFEQSQLELAELFMEKEEKPKKPRRRRKKKVVEEDTPE